MFHVWNRKLHRPTRDIDLLGFGPDDPESLRNVMLHIIRVPCPEDGLSFDESSLAVAPIREDKWIGFLRKNGLQADGFPEVVGRIRNAMEWIWKT